MRQRRLMNQINVVPYIDVMLVLLVIFMVTAPMIQTGTVALPSVGEAGATPSAPLEITVHGDRHLTLRDRAARGEAVPVTAAQLATRSYRPEQAVLIAGDKDVPYEAVLEVMSILQQARVAKIGLLVKPRS